MQDFVGFKIPLWVRRLATMVPTFIVIALGVDATQALVISQVVLSIILPIPITALIIITSRRDIMGDFANSFATNAAAIIGGCVVLTLNVILLLQIAGIPTPFLKS
jgi:manganese transport protein